MEDTKSLNKYISAQRLRKFTRSRTLPERQQLWYFLWIMVQSVAVHSTLYQLELLASGEETTCQRPHSVSTQPFS